jgi:hypothetical protein
VAYNLRTLALPEAVKHWSLTTLRSQPRKIGAKIVRRGRTIAFQMAEVSHGAAHTLPADPFGNRGSASINAADSMSGVAGINVPQADSTRRTVSRSHRKALFFRTDGDHRPARHTGDILATLPLQSQTDR